MIARWTQIVLGLLVVVATCWSVAWMFAGPQAALSPSRVVSADVVPAPAPVALSQPVAGVFAGNAALVSSDWARSTAEKTGIPTRAVRAYGGAELVLRTQQPDCRLGWTTLAAVGAIESGHGTHGGSSLDVAGLAVPAIVGPRLDGAGVAAIAATIGAPHWASALGPLQFIPSTWQRWGADGNADGAADPQQIDDAALAAAHYLCSYGDLSGAATWRSAVFGYNHSVSYVDRVARVASDYRTSVG